MAVLLVGYDLNSPGQDYGELIEHLKSVGAWWHHLDSTWLLKTSRTPSQLRDELSSFLDSNDELLVLDVTSDSWATKGIAKTGTDWIRNNL
jgi:hypothetical protein